MTKYQSFTKLPQISHIHEKKERHVSKLLLNFCQLWAVKVKALWFGCYGVILWFLSGKNESEWFLLFTLSDICLRYSCAQFSVCVLRQFIITSLMSYVLGLKSRATLFTHIVAWYISVQLRKTQTYLGKTKISSNFPLKLSIFVIFYEK